MIEANSKDYPIRMLCWVLEIPKSVYYEWLKMPVAKLQQKTKDLDRMIKTIFYEHKCRYGSTRITKELKDFTAVKPNQKWLTDITYIPTDEGWLYLCAVIDVYSRAIIG